MRRGLALPLVVVAILASGLFWATWAAGFPDRGTACVWRAAAQPATLYGAKGPKSQYGSGPDIIHLNSVAAFSKDDVWTVGSYEWSDGDGPDPPLVEHWNGTQWRVVPDAAPRASALFGVAAVTSTDVWAVGTGQTDRGGNYTEHPLIEHWDGKGWSVVPDNAPAKPKNSQLLSVTAVGTKDIWAVGGSDAGHQRQAALIEHWDGSRWQAVSSPVSPAVLSSVSAASSKDVWALSPVGHGGIVEHWNGAAWKSYGPSVGRAVFTLSRRDAWAVDGDEPPGPSVEHWDGQAWKVAKKSAPGNAYLTGVVAVSAKNVWAVGGDRVLHWDGKRWSLVRTPSADLNAVTAISASDMWTVGEAFTAEGAAKSDALVLRYSCS